MKIFTDRHKISKLLNFNKYPVLSLDLAKDKRYILEGEEDTRYYKGHKVKWQKSDYYWHGDLCYFTDTKKLQISNDNACITASFGYHDIIEDLEIAKAPIIKENSEVVVVIYDSDKHLACVCLASIKEFSHHYSTLTTIEGDWGSIIESLERA